MKIITNLIKARSLKVARHVIPATLLVSTGLFSSAMAQASSPAADTGSDFDIIIYDAETIEALNAKPATTPSQMPQRAPAPAQPLVASMPTPTQNVAPKPKNGPPYDFSDQIFEVIAGVPIIENPTSCGKNDLEIGLVIENVANSKGTIVIDLHDDVKENFLVWDKVVLRVRQDANEGETTSCLPLTKPGDYAIAVYHDKNGNKEFDKGFLGIPKEHFGMSQNPKFGLSSPKYEETVFTVPASGKKIRIIMRKASDVI